MSCSKRKQPFHFLHVTYINVTMYHVLCAAMHIVFSSPVLNVEFDGLEEEPLFCIAEPTSQMFMFLTESA